MRKLKSRGSSQGGSARFSWVRKQNTQRQARPASAMPLTRQVARAALLHPWVRPTKGRPGSCAVPQGLTPTRPDAAPSLHGSQHGARRRRPRGAAGRGREEVAALRPRHPRAERLHRHQQTGKPSGLRLAETRPPSWGLCDLMLAQNSPGHWGPWSCFSGTPSSLRSQTCYSDEDPLCP